MIRIGSGILVVFLIGCGNSENYPIEDELDSRQFYSTQLEQFDNQNKSKSPEKSQVFKKLYAAQQLGWPTDISKDLDQLILQEGLDLELYQYAADYYDTKNDYDKLNMLVDRWLLVHKPTSEDYRRKVISLMALGEPAKAREYLWKLATKSNSLGALVFSGKSFLDMNDTASSMVAFSRLAEADPSNPALLNNYLPLLLNTGYTEKAKALLIHQEPYIKDYNGHAILAKTLFQIGEKEEAIDILQDYENIQAYQQLTSWYQTEEQYDSASIYMDKWVSADSSREALFRKAILLEEWGRLNDSYDHLNLIIRRDSTDSVAISRAEIVWGKIAYLRRLRESQRKIPVLNISRKKSTDNE